MLIGKHEVVFNGSEELGVVFLAKGQMFLQYIVHFLLSQVMISIVKRTLLVDFSWWTSSNPLFWS